MGWTWPRRIQQRQHMMHSCLALQTRHARLRGNPTHAPETVLQSPGIQNPGTPASAASHLNAGMWRTLFRRLQISIIRRAAKMSKLRRLYFQRALDTIRPNRCAVSNSQCSRILMLQRSRHRQIKIRPLRLYISRLHGLQTPCLFAKWHLATRGRDANGLTSLAVSSKNHHPAVKKSDGEDNETPCDGRFA